MLKEYSKSIVNNSMNIIIFIIYINSLLSIVQKTSEKILKNSNKFKKSKI